MVVYQKRFFSLPPAVALDNSTSGGGSKTAGPFQTSDATSNDGGGDKSGDTCPSMVPKAVLLCRPNSHPFQDRYIPADQPIKVGRAVARCRQAINNAIFDCKVLSRNHASLWYENGKFFLQDTKSSNGTFVNNQRLSKGGEESPPREVSSGDIVQFGVDVLENSRKVTHGCIIATLKLYLPDGKEAKASPTISLASASHDVTISSQELYQLSQYLQEAMHREQTLENKLTALQRVVSSSQDCTDTNWKAMVEEDHLLTKLQTLEGQLLACSKNLNEEKLRQELHLLLEEKGGYQNIAKGEMQKALEEKIEAQKKAQDLETTLTRSEEESKRLWELYTNTDKELWTLWEEHNKTKKELVDINKKLKEAEEGLEETSCRAGEEKAVLEKSLEIMGKKVQQLSSQLESLQAECDFSKEQLAVMKGRLEELKDGPDEYVRISQGIQVDISLKENLDSNQKGILIESEDEISNLKAQLRMSKEEEEKSVNQTLALQAEINRLKTELDQVHLENEKNDLSTKSYNHHNGEVHSLDHLREEIDRLKELLDETKEQKHLAQEEIEKLTADRVLYIQKVDVLKEDMEKMAQEVKEKSALASSLTQELHQVRLEAEQAQQEVKALKEKLTSEEHWRKIKSEEIANLRKEMSLVHQQAMEQKAEADSLKKKLQSLSGIEVTEHSQVKQLHQENATLRARIESLNAQIQRQRLENAKLMDEKNGDKIEVQTDITLNSTLLQPSTSEVDSGESESYISSLEAEMLSLRSQLLDSCENNITLQDHFARCNEERAYLQKELDTLSEEFDILTIQTRMASACSVIPLIILLLAAVFAFQPTISHFTATWDASPL